MWAVCHCWLWEVISSPLVTTVTTSCICNICLSRFSVPMWVATVFTMAQGNEHLGEQTKLCDFATEVCNEMCSSNVKGNYLPKWQSLCSRKGGYFWGPRIAWLSNVDYGWMVEQMAGRPLSVCVEVILMMLCMLSNVDAHARNISSFGLFVMWRGNGSMPIETWSMFLH